MQPLGEQVMLLEVLVTTTCTLTDRQAVGDAQEIPIPTLTSEVLALASARATSRPRYRATMRTAGLRCGYLAAMA